MQEQHILNRLQQYIRNQMNDGSDHLSTGGAQSFDEYHRMVGRIEGLAMAERELLDLMQKLFNETE
tara:strand:- start:756 stop:953 length:198 start_codon:yes stop_codon:yes gene_type:complete